VCGGDLAAAEETEQPVRIAYQSARTFRAKHAVGRGRHLALSFQRTAESSEGRQ